MRDPQYQSLLLHCTTFSLLQRHRVLLLLPNKECGVQTIVMQAMYMYNFC
jgi:hypothetical protein